MFCSHTTRSLLSPRTNRSTLTAQALLVLKGGLKGHYTGATNEGTGESVQAPWASSLSPLTVLRASNRYMRPYTASAFPEATSSVMPRRLASANPRTNVLSKHVLFHSRKLKIPQCNIPALQTPGLSWAPMQCQRPQQSSTASCLAHWIYAPSSLLP